MRISQAAIAKILWHAIEAGADGPTLNAIRLYITDPTRPAPQGIDSVIYARAVAETDRAALRSSRAREAAARRRAANHDSTSATTEVVTEVQKVETTAVVTDGKSARSLDRKRKKEKRRALRARRKGTGAVMNTSSPWRQAPSGR